MFRYRTCNSALSIDLISRRGVLRVGGFTFGGLALADLLQDQVQWERLYLALQRLTLTCGRAGGALAVVGRIPRARTVSMCS
jgi:hypothetical protein